MWHISWLGCENDCWQKRHWNWEALLRWDFNRLVGLFFGRLWRPKNREILFRRGSRSAEEAHTQHLCCWTEWRKKMKTNTEVAFQWSTQKHFLGKNITIRTRASLQTKPISTKTVSPPCFFFSEKRTAHSNALHSSNYWPLSQKFEQNNLQTKPISNQTRKNVLSVFFGKRTALF